MCSGVHLEVLLLTLILVERLKVVAMTFSLALQTDFSLRFGLKLAPSLTHSLSASPPML